MSMSYRFLVTYINIEDQQINKLARFRSATISSQTYAFFLGRRVGSIFGFDSVAKVHNYFLKLSIDNILLHIIQRNFLIFRLSTALFQYFCFSLMRTNRYERNAQVEMVPRNATECSSDLVSCDFSNTPLTYLQGNVLSSIDI